MLNLSKNLILGSQSPRRKELLSGLNVSFEIRVPQVEEVFPASLPTKEVALFLADLKFSALQQSLLPNEIALTADTVVLINNTVLGKPSDAKEAKEMLQMLSNNCHSVITGVAIGSAVKKIGFSCETKVWFNPLSEEEIKYYLERYKPYDKAGSYGIQEWIGYVGIQKIEGCFYNVMGLPVAPVYRELSKFNR
ncbi:MAG: Maf family nucleotide pyrophosphatase [Luteibaculaceae bacterium]